jgi:prepilin-type N-terminal cleavage/methylation domain-containing protein
MVANLERRQRRHVESEHGPGRRSSKSEAGFTLVEFLVATLIMSLVLGGTVGLANRISQGYQSQLDDSVVEQEARYALDWIARDLRSAGSDPYNVIAANQGIFLDPNGGADNDDSIRIQADINPANGVIAGAGTGENVTIALDLANRVITRADTGAAATPMTDAIFTDLSFTYLDASRAVTATSDLVAYIRVQVTARSRGRNPSSATAGGFTTATLGTEVRVRTR